MWFEYRHSPAHDIKATAIMPERTRFSADELRLLCDCIATVCFNIAGGRGNVRFLPAADAVLAELGLAAHSRLSETGLDLVQLVLAEFASPSLRKEVLTRVGKSPSREDLAAGYPASLTVPALELIDNRCPEQAFPFRAASILIAMAIEDELARGCVSRHACIELAAAVRVTASHHLREKAT